MIHEERAGINKSKDQQTQGRTFFWINTGDKVVNIIATVEPCSGYRYFKKKVYSYDRCHNRIYLNNPLLIIYLSAIETLICHTEIEVNRIYFLRFCTKYDDFLKYGIELIVALSSTNATKILCNRRHIN